MATVAVIGANGQVGSEVCLFLSLLDGVEVVPICRTRYGGAFLRRCGLSCRYGSVEDASAARELLAGCDLVADFSLPRGPLSAMHAASERLIGTALREASPGAAFAYVSSTMAYGLDAQNAYRDFRVARTSYAAMKRHAERFTFRVGCERGRDVFVLRLGQVHGELQRVSAALLRELRADVPFVPQGSSDVVFAFSIAEGLASIASGGEVPGRYSLVSVPAWTWGEVYSYYAWQLGISGRYIEVPNGNESRPIGQRAAGVVRSLAHAGIARASRHRELLTVCCLARFPSAERRVKALYSCRNAAAEIASGTKYHGYRPFNVPSGAVPGERLRGLSDSRESMPPVAEQVREIVRIAGRRD